MRIGFYATGCIPVHARTLEERPLGGIETGLIRLAEALQGRGHDIVVFTPHPNPVSTPGGPQYSRVDSIRDFSSFDVVVLVKDWVPALFQLPTRNVVYWTGDGFDQFATYGLGDARTIRRISAFLAVSEWHSETMCEKSGFPREKTFVLGNGVHLPYFEGVETRERKRIIFTAAPYRGLDLAAMIFERVKHVHRDATFEVFSGLQLYDTLTPFEGAEKSSFEKLARTLSTMPGCTLHGNVTQAVLARELMKSSVLLYPNTIFETSCITAMEGQAAGCPVVASATSALPETVGGGGIIIQGSPGSPLYLDSATAALDQLLSDDLLWERYSGEGKKRAREMLNWGYVAARFEDIMKEVQG